MAPIPTTALVGRLLASAHNALNIASSLPTRSPPIRHSLSTIPIFSAPSHTPLTPSIAFHRIARVLLEHYNAKHTKRDDSTNTTNNNHLTLIFPIVVGAIFLGAIWGCTRDHFRKGGTYKSYAKAWFTAIKVFVFLTIFLPLTIAGCIINCRTAKQKARQGGVIPLANRPVGGVGGAPAAGSDPPPPNRPQMPLDPVVVMPDMPDQEDPDAVDNVAPIVLLPPPPPVLQKNETTAEATEVFLANNTNNANNNNKAATSGLVKGPP